MHSRSDAFLHVDTHILDKHKFTCTYDHSKVQTDAWTFLYGGIFVEHMCTINVHVYIIYNTYNVACTYTYTDVWTSHDRSCTSTADWTTLSAPLRPTTNSTRGSSLSATQMRIRTWWTSELHKIEVFHNFKIFRKIKLPNFMDLIDTELSLLWQFSHLEIAVDLMVPTWIQAPSWLCWVQLGFFAHAAVVLMTQR